MLVCVLVTVSLSVPTPLITKYLIDNILIGGNYALTLPLASLFLVVIILQLLVGRFFAWLMSSYMQDFINEMRVKLVNSFLRASASCRISAGNLMVITNSDIPSLAQLNIAIVTTIFQSMFSIIGFSMMLFYLNLKLAIISLAIFPVYYVWVRYVSGKMQALTRKSQQINEELLSSVEGIERNAQTIKIYDYVSYKESAFSSITHRIGSFAKQVAMYTNFVGSVSSTITAIATFIPLVVGIYFIGSHEMTVGGLMGFNSYCGMLFAPISALIDLTTKKKIRAVHEERIYDFLASVKKNAEPDYLVDVKCPIHRIEVYDFALMSYGRKLFEVKNLVMGQGECLLVCGGNGVGKSLFLQSLAGLYDCYSGRISYDGIRKEYLNDRSISKAVVYVSPQQNFVLDTMRQEILDHSVLPRSVVSSLTAEFGLDGYLGQPAEEIDTPTDELTKKLNTGSMQKLRIVRALSRNPSFMFLDEILSNIEVAQCRHVVEVIRTHLPDLCIVVIEHHLEISDQFDAVLRIEECGISYSRGGKFYK